MATYKVLQDIEAEDKLLGPLTMRQFIYAAIVALLCFISYRLSSVNILLVTPFIFPIAFFALLAAPFGTDQSSEVWLLAKIRFSIKPRRRIWNQTGIKDLVTITVPKKIEQVYTDGLSQGEVKSRLNALASTLDSRGWAVKNVDVNLYSQPSYIAGDTQSSSDRLIDAGSLPQEVPSYEISAADDMMDAANNPMAQKLTAMIDQSSQQQHQAMVQAVHAPSTATNDNRWFVTQQTQQPTQDDQASLDAARARQLSRQDPTKTHLKTVRPSTEKQAPANPKHVHKTEGQHSATPAPSPDILRLAGNDDLNISTIARQAHKSEDTPDDEVVISLR